MDETAALRDLIAKCESQISNQSATICHLRRDLAQCQAENRALTQRLTARETLEALGFADVEPAVVEEAPLPAVPTTLDAWTAWVEGLFASTRRHN
jgi:hypothetical protein